MELLVTQFFFQSFVFSLVELPINSHQHLTPQCSILWFQLLSFFIEWLSLFVQFLNLSFVCIVLRVIDRQVRVFIYNVLCWEEIAVTLLCISFSFQITTLSDNLIKYSVCSIIVLLFIQKNTLNILIERNFLNCKQVVDHSQTFVNHTLSQIVVHDVTYEEVLFRESFSTFLNST